MLMSSLNIGEGLRDKIVKFDILILPIILFVLFTFNSKLIKRAKALTFNINKINEFEKLEYKDPRLLIALFWLVSIYVIYFES